MPAAASRAAASRVSALVTTAHGMPSRSSSASSSSAPVIGTTSRDVVVLDGQLPGHGRGEARRRRRSGRSRRMVWSDGLPWITPRRAVCPVHAVLVGPAQPAPLDGGVGVDQRAVHVEQHGVPRCVRSMRRSLSSPSEEKEVPVVSVGRPGPHRPLAGRRRRAGAGAAAARDHPGRAGPAAAAEQRLGRGDHRAAARAAPAHRGAGPGARARPADRGAVRAPGRPAGAGRASCATRTGAARRSGWTGGSAR